MSDNDDTVTVTDVMASMELNEIHEHIKNYDVNTVNNGYLCSCCDPFLILICEIFNINITNNYNGVKIYYRNIMNKKSSNIKIF